jgi:predicted DNA-binding transcriptional regulator YafY
MSLEQLQQHLDGLIYQATCVRDLANDNLYDGRNVKIDLVLQNLKTEAANLIPKFIRWKQAVEPVSIEDTIQRAFDDKVLLSMTYRDAKGRSTTRTVKAIRLDQRRGSDVLTAWCHTRDAMRHFILDRILSLSIEGESTPSFTGRQLQQAFTGTRRPQRAISFT